MVKLNFLSNLSLSLEERKIGVGSLPIEMSINFILLEGGVEVDKEERVVELFSKDKALHGVKLGSLLINLPLYKKNLINHTT